MEENIIVDLKIKVYGTWSKIFCMLGEEASSRIMEFVYGENSFRIMSLEIVREPCLYYPRIVHPTFSDLSPRDVGQIMNSRNSVIAPFFWISYSIDIGLAAQFINCPMLLKVDNH